MGDYTLTLGSGILAYGLDINLVSLLNSTITLSGASDLTLTAPAVSVQNGRVAFDVPLSSTVGLTLTADHISREARLNTANPNLQGVTTITSGTLVYNTTGALGPETTGTSNSIEIGNGTLQFNSAVGGNFSYSLAEPIKF